MSRMCLQFSFDHQHASHRIEPQQSILYRVTKTHLEDEEERVTVVSASENVFADGGVPKASGFGQAGVVRRR